MRRSSFFLAAAIVVAGVAEAATKGDEAPVRRILTLYENESTLFAVQQISAALEAGLLNAFPAGIELYSEYLDTVRFPDGDHAERLGDTIAAKYRDVPLDAVIAVGPGAIAFWSDHLPDLSDTPLIVGAVRSDSQRLGELPPGANGVLSSFDLGRTLDLARRLQPDAKRMVVMTGSSDFDQSWEKTAREEFDGQVPGLDVDYVSGLSLDGFKRVASELEPDTILLILTVFEDSEGRKLIPRDAAAKIAAASSAPAYSVYSSYIGAGVVGGYVQTFTSIGEEMAALAARVLSDDPPTPVIVAAQARPVVDWRQLRRWGIDDALLPQGTETLFYEPPAWIKYRPQILLAATVILLQALTIAALFVQDRRRRRIAGELALERDELTHLSRASQLGELSGALAHELNQPLTAILANAEAGAQLLKQDPLDSRELGEILADIAADDRRAAGIIAQLRRLMVKGETALDLIDLNQVVAATVILSRSELLSRQTTCQVLRNQAVLTARGNFPQLQQVVLNLILNAAEAVSTQPPAQRQIVIETRARPDGHRELSVADNGPGMPPDLRLAAFRPFVSTKPNGLGFGLSICRSIARAHGGTLDFDDAAREGTRVVFVLPPV